MGDSSRQSIGTANSAPSEPPSQPSLSRRGSLVGAIPTERRASLTGAARLGRELPSSAFCSGAFPNSTWWPPRTPAQETCWASIPPTASSSRRQTRSLPSPRQPIPPPLPGPLRAVSIRCSRPTSAISLRRSSSAVRVTSQEAVVHLIFSDSFIFRILSRVYEYMYVRVFSVRVCLRIYMNIT